MGMDRDSAHQVIEMIQHRIKESHTRDHALKAEGDRLDIQLRREQEYGRRAALLELWQDVLNSVTDTHQS